MRPLLVAIALAAAPPLVAQQSFTHSWSDTVVLGDTTRIYPVSVSSAYLVGPPAVIIKGPGPPAPIDSIVTPPPPPPPPPPPVSTRKGVGLGPFNATLGNGATLYAVANSPAGLASQLAAARAGGYCIRAVPTGGRHAKYMKGGKWDLGLWTTVIDSFAKKANVWAGYAKDGTLCGVSINDEWQAGGVWGGSPIPYALIDKAACHAKTIFPGATIYTRTDATDFPANPGCVGGAMLQYSASKGDVKVYAAKQLAAARAKGLVLTIGVNAENGGKKVAGCPASQTRAGACQMSGAELTAYFAAMDADTSLVCGGTLWFQTAAQYDAYRARADQKAALAKLTASWRTRARPARCGG